MGKKEKTESRQERNSQQRNRRLVDAIVKELMQRHEPEFWVDYVEIMKKHGRSVPE